MIQDLLDKHAAVFEAIFAAFGDCEKAIDRAEDRLRRLGRLQQDLAPTSCAEELAGKSNFAGILMLDGLSGVQSDVSIALDNVSIQFRTMKVN